MVITGFNIPIIMAKLSISTSDFECHTVGFVIGTKEFKKLEIILAFFIQVCTQGTNLDVASVLHETYS